MPDDDHTIDDGYDLVDAPELTYHHEQLAPLPGGVGLNTAAYGGGAAGAFMLALVGLIKRKRARSRMAELDD